MSWWWKVRVSSTRWSTHKLRTRRTRSTYKLWSSWRRSKRSMPWPIKRRSSWVRGRPRKTWIWLGRTRSRWSRWCGWSSILWCSRSWRRTPIRRSSCRRTCSTRGALKRRWPLEARWRPRKVLPWIGGKVLGFWAGRRSLPGGSWVLQRGWQRDGRGYAPGTASWKKKCRTELLKRQKFVSPKFQKSRGVQRKKNKNS